jgi:kynurenine formamidase
MALPPWFHELAGEVRNWGRWGVDDEIGTLNLIDAEARRRGAASVRTGQAFSLALPLHADGIQTGTIKGRINPVHTMVAINEAMSGDPSEFCTSDDQITMGVQAATHWDGLAHVSYDGLLYNGFPSGSITALQGATRLGVEKIGPMVSRGVLLDVARARGVDVLDGNSAITGDDLDAAASMGRVDVQPGDIVLVRTGKLGVLALHPEDRFGYMYPSPGLSTKSVKWFRSHDVAAVATDTLVFECYPCEDPAAQLPVHLLHLRDMGLTQGQNFVLDALADACAEDGTYTFLLDASPLPIVGGTGAMVAPVAVR